MKFRKTVSLKDSRECLLRNPEVGDAGAILRHLIQTSGETGFMARYADEIVLTEEQERAYLAQLESDPKAGMVSAVVDQSIVANAGFNPVATLEKYCHRAEFGMSVQKNYWGMGIGSALLAAVIETARQAGYEQMELEVVPENERAVRLYQKFGFRIYGTREKSFRYRDGSYASEYLMLLQL
jgi:ribosomal protein S18 acetylase RimI-like enzyme